MYQVEKIGDLILVSLQGQVDQGELNGVLSHIDQMAGEVSEGVLSFHFDQMAEPLDPSVDSAMEVILHHCHQKDIRVYAYRFPPHALEEPGSGGGAE